MRHLVIPDVQAKPGNSDKFLFRIAQYIADKQPEKIICIGDFADMQSLSSYDKGKKSFEGRRYTKDIDAAKRSMDTLMAFLSLEPHYRPKLILTLGNHENRIDRAVEQQAELEGLISTKDLAYESYGWEVQPFLNVISVDGVAYSHYFVSGSMGRPIGTARLLLTKKHQTCIAGHQQGFQIATDYNAEGRSVTGIIAGSCYEHNEDYMGPQGNKHWRGILMLNDVSRGEVEPMQVSLKYLKQRYK